MEKRLVSACLLGVNCRYDGKSKPNEKVIKLSEKEILIPACPEQLGGLLTPRVSAGIYGGFGKDVLDGKASVRTIEYGKDITEYFIEGAKEVLRLVKLYNIKEAILKQKSPSCGCGLTWRLNDDFKNSVTEGNGVTAALLKRNGINVLTEEDVVMIKEFQDKEIISQGFNPFEEVNRTYLLVDKSGDIIQIRQQPSRDIEGRTEFLFMKYRQEDSKFKAYSQGEIMGTDLRKSLKDIFKK